MQRHGLVESQPPKVGRMAHYPAYGAQREGRVPGQPASVVMGGLDTISANSEVGQPHPGAPPVPADRARGPGEKLLGLSVWVQRLRGVPAGGVPAGGAGTPPNGMRVAEAQERPRAVPANVERLPPGVPLFGALREFGPRGGVPQSAGGRQSPDERPADEGSAHEGAESPRERKEEEEANDEPETPTSGPSPTPAPPLPNATNQARGSGPSTGGPVFVGGVRNSTDTASRSVEGPSTADGNPNPNPNPKPSSSSQQRSRGGGYGPSLASRRYGLAEALREQQEAAAVRRWMSKSESGSHAYKASNGTGASGGAGSRPSTEVGLPSPSVGAPLKQFAEAGPPEMAGGGGGRREQGGVENGFSARRNGVLQLDGEEARGRQGGAAEKQDGREKVYEEQANQPNAFGTGFGSFGSLNKDSGLPAGVRGVEGQPNGLGGKFKEAQEGEGKSLEGSGGSRGGARRGMGSWVERLGIGSGSRDAVNQAQKEGAVGKTNVVEGSGVGRASTAGGDLDMAGGGLGRSKDEAGGQTKAPSEGGAAASNGAAGRNSEGEGSAGSRKRGGKGFRPNGGLNFLPSFRMPPPLVIPGENQAPEPEVQDVLEAGECVCFTFDKGLMCIS